ncbi:hypothetical protein [Saccharothrix sp. HUAS TT1]|uniref:hypothetical protein n=1 Tax=unclassified Saccharothrix TaxID=2593673 RepID=UPI00345C45B4
MIEPAGPHPRSVYRRRRALAVAGSVVALVLAVWLVGAVVGREPERVAQRAAASTPPPPPQRPVAPPPSSSSPAPAPESPQPTLPPGPPPPCEDAQVAVTAEVDQQDGRAPRFAVVVANTGPLPCTKEIGRRVRELVVTSADGGTRLWSSNDCFATEGSEVRVMRPGERFTYDLRWPGSTSAPGCRSQTRLGGGDYLLTAVVAGRASNPVIFRVT